MPTGSSARRIHAPTGPRSAADGSSRNARHRGRAGAVIVAGAAPVRPIAIGAIAHAALGRAGGVARVLARLTASTYLTAGDQITWLGATSAPLHPRAIVVADAPIVRTDELQVVTEGLSPWTPCTPRLDVTTAG